MDGYVGRIALYEVDVKKLERHIELLEDRISALEKSITDSGGTLPPLGRRRSDERKTHPLNRP